MKKTILGLLLTILLGLPVAVLALNIGTNPNDPLGKAVVTAGYDTATSETTLATNIGFVIGLALSFASVIFMSLMVYAGYLWMTARGDEGKVDKAIEIIRAAVIGMIITVGAYSITNFVVPKILEQTTGSEADYGVCCTISVTGDPQTSVSFIPGALNTDVCNEGCPSGSTCTGVTNQTADQCQ